MKKGPVICIAGGGAAGFFAAIHIARLVPDAQVTIFEKSSQVLGKVRVSGGGRCNTTHACFDNRQLIRYYPRGGKALLGPLSRFTTTDTIEWFSNEGVELKTEQDGRMFPVTDNSETIVNALQHAAQSAGVNVKYNQGIQKIEKKQEGWQLEINNEKIDCDVLVMATGSSNQCWQLLENLSINVVPPVPSLFTLHIPDKSLQALSGVSVNMVTMKLEKTKIATEGPLLITHWGFSGPATLKLSAFAARELAEMQYNAAVLVNFLPEQKPAEILETLEEARSNQSRKQPRNSFLFEDIPRRLWEYLLLKSGVTENMNWADVPNRYLNKLTEELSNGRYPVIGKSTFKEEFVTCGGIHLDEVDLKTMAAKKYPGLYFCGEIMNVDAVTGGFNFQWAWSSGYIAARGIAGMFKDSVSE